jgi:predicted CoA-binding protein
VNPHTDEIFGKRAYRTLAQVPEQVDFVDVFRPSGQTPDIARGRPSRKAQPPYGWSRGQGGARQGPILYLAPLRTPSTT